GSVLGASDQRDQAVRRERDRRTAIRGTDRSYADELRLASPDAVGERPYPCRATSGRIVRAPDERGLSIRGEGDGLALVGRAYHVARVELRRKPPDPRSVPGEDESSSSAGSVIGRSDERRVPVRRERDGRALIRAQRVVVPKDRLERPAL